MRNALKVTGVKAARGAPLVLEFDEFVPLQFRTYHEVLGSGYLQLGNRSTTLIDLAVEAYSQVVRAVTVTSFDVLSPWPPFSITARSDGLPILSTDFEGWRVVDLEREFKVSVRDGQILISWGELDLCEVLEFQRQVRFLVRGGEFAGVWFVGLSKEDIKLFLSHAQGIAPI